MTEPHAAPEPRVAEPWLKPSVMSAALKGSGNAALPLPDCEAAPQAVGEGKRSAFA